MTTDQLILTDREQEVLELENKGFSTEEMAERLGPKEATIRWHRSNARKKIERAKKVAERYG